MKKFINKFKNWVSINKKTLIQLFCWLLFMTLVVLFVRHLNNEAIKEKEDFDSKIEVLNTMDDYIYECLYNDVVYNGRVFPDGKEEMYVDELGEIKTFYYDTEWYQIVDEERVTVSEYVPRMKPKETYNIIKEGTYSIKQKENGFDKYVFVVSADVLNMDSDKVFYVNVYFKNDKISAADILGQYCAYNLVEGE